MLGFFIRKGCLAMSPSKIMVSKVMKLYNMLLIETNED